MTAAECSVFLRKYNNWRRSDAEDNRESEMPHPRDIGLAIESAIVFIEQRDELLTLLVEFSDALQSDEYMARKGSTPGPLLNAIRQTIARAKGGSA